MAAEAPHAELHPALKRLLAGLRSRIRLYIWVEGLSLAVAWLGLMFWVGFALDYLPVLAGSNEMPRGARFVLLAITGGVLAWVLQRYLLRRVFATLSDHSLALVLERRFTEFKDSLVTSVELTGVSLLDRNFNADMFGHTESEAIAKTSDVIYARVFNYRPVLRSVLAAAGLVISIVIFFAVNSPIASQAAARLVLLQDNKWVRQAKIEILGVDLERPPTPGSTTPMTVPLEFDRGVIKVAKGSNLRLKVRAASGLGVQIVPRTCTVYYRTESNGDYPSENGRVILSKYRETPEGRQFQSEGKPFVGILSSVRFDVVGYDYRVRDYRIEVVESPAVVETLVDLKYPDYMVDLATSSHLPAADQPYVASGTSIPVGTEVTLKFRTNKPLKQALVRNSDTNEEITLAAKADPFKFEHRIPALKESQALEITLTDADNVTMDRPYRVLIAAIVDEPPQVDVAMKGIGMFVTPDVVMPLEGKTTDDYGVAKAWIEILVGEEQPRQLPLTIGKGGAVERKLDFRALRSDNDPLALKPKDKLTIGVNATDKHNLDGGPHLGQGDRRQIDVVTPEELLSQLEVRELGLRRRFEQIVDEMAQLRDSLLRVKASLAGDSKSASEPGEGEPGDKPLTPEQLAQRERELRLLRVQRAVQQSKKSRQETSGVAEAFLDIREELINNRVDTEERKERLKDLIATPLAQIVAAHFPELDRRLVALEKSLDDSASAPGLADASIDQANEVLAEMDKVLQKMLDLETFNELVDLVRDLLKSQDDLLDRTKQERKRQAVEELK